MSNEGAHDSDKLAKAGIVLGSSGTQTDWFHHRIPLSMFEFFLSFLLIRD